MIRHPRRGIRSNLTIGKNNQISHQCVLMGSTAFFAKLAIAIAKGTSLWPKGPIDDADEAKTDSKCCNRLERSWRGYRSG